MPKAVAVGRIDVPGITTPFEANVAPDPFDARDLLYRPRLQALPDAVDSRPKQERFVMEQDGSSCTGHAVATMINSVLAAKMGKPPYERVSPYMLYYLARRYDEFSGEDDLGSSLRGVLKGWWRHGVVLNDEWPKLHTFRDLEDKTITASCRKRPLGAFYRVDTQRLDDMQSAICELNAIVASAMVHDGWSEPEETELNGKTIRVIRKKPDSKPLGGHAFAIVGYNAVGFLVQNSWGETWGKGGFATLPYEDWIECSYDAWVARPGVPQTPFEHLTRTMTAAGTIGVTAAPPADVIRNHVLNVGNDGRLSTTGAATSSRTQLEALIATMKGKHKEWGSRQTVIYIHGGLNSESSGLARAQAQHQWWLNNRIYPIFIAWQSSPLETLINQIADLVKAPFGAVPSFFEALDRAVEGVCANVIPFGWSQMKDNAMKACDPLASLPPNDADWFKAPGATLLLRLLKKYQNENGALRLHVVAHSAGAVYVNGLIPRLAAIGLGVESMTMMAAASRLDDFDKLVVPHLGSVVKRVTSFTLNDGLELDDTVGPVYHKSLLYLVSRGFERPAKREVPLVGMEHFFNEKLKSGKTLRQTIPSTVVSAKSRPSGVTDDSFSTSRTHGGFDDDEPTMTATLLRILGLANVTADVQRYKENAAPVALAPAVGVRAATSPVVGGAVVANVAIRVKDRRRVKRTMKVAKRASSLRKET